MVVFSDRRNLWPFFFDRLEYLILTSLSGSQRICDDIFVKTYEIPSVCVLFSLLSGMPKRKLNTFGTRFFFCLGVCTYKIHLMPNKYLLSSPYRYFLRRIPAFWSKKRVCLLNSQLWTFSRLFLSILLFPARSFSHPNSLINLSSNLNSETTRKCVNCASTIVTISSDMEPVSRWPFGDKCNWWRLSVSLHRRSWRCVEREISRFFLMKICLERFPKSLCYRYQLGKLIRSFDYFDISRQYS